MFSLPTRQIPTLDHWPQVSNCDALGTPLESILDVSGSGIFVSTQLASCLFKIYLRLHKKLGQGNKTAWLGERSAVDGNLTDSLTFSVVSKLVQTWQKPLMWLAGAKRVTWKHCERSHGTKKHIPGRKSVVFCFFCWRDANFLPLPPICHPAKRWYLTSWKWGRWYLNPNVALLPSSHWTATILDTLHHSAFSSQKAKQAQDEYLLRSVVRSRFHAWTWDQSDDESNTIRHGEEMSCNVNTFCPTGVEGVPLPHVAKTA